MQFEYADYYRTCLIVTLSILLFSLLFFSSSVASCIELILAYKKNHMINKNKIFSVIFVLAISGLFISINVGYLLNGGIYLIREKESDAIEIQGEITNIEELGQFSFPNMNTVRKKYKGNQSHGVQFTIGGSQYKAITKGDLEVGDYVTVVCLPKSGYVLSIYKVDDG